MESNTGVPWVGGRDLSAGGTWLGINRNGLMVAVTNRSKSKVPLNPRSRGLLCRDLLEQPSFEEAQAELHRQWKEYPFAGFNLLLFSRTEGFVFEGGDEPREHLLEPGIHTIANAGLNDSNDPRVVRVARAIEQLAGSTTRLEDWIDEASRLAGLHAEGDQPPVCLHRNGSGTVSTTILALTEQVNEARYLFAPGTPCETAFDDYSPLLQSLLSEPLR